MKTLLVPVKQNTKACTELWICNAGCSETLHKFKQLLLSSAGLRHMSYMNISEYCKNALKAKFLYYQWVNIKIN